LSYATLPRMDQEPRLCDYEGSSYQTDFWEGQGREYEDLAERAALRRLLPPSGLRLLDIGAGFGRLSEFYDHFEQVVLLDYSRSLLRQAQTRLGRDDRIVYVASSFYSMPFVDNAFDAAMMVRVMHHVEDVPSLLKQVVRILAGNGCYVLEYASKQHLKAILRFGARRQAWNPFDRAPYEFAEMNFDFHPAWMQDRLAEAGFHVKRRLTVSHFRLPLLKRLVPARMLAAADSLCQPTGAWWQLTPSIFVQCTPPASTAAPATSHLFRCPACCGTSLQPGPDVLTCDQCDTRWPIEDGIYNFTPRPPT
jgi:ubiquinone/menaquinone biosynthesis C-methylase UbiE